MIYRYFYRKMAELFTNSGDHDQTSRSAASDLGLHCLSNTLFRGFQTTMGLPNYVAKIPD